MFAQSGPGSSIFPSTGARSLVDIWGSLSDGLGGATRRRRPSSTPRRGRRGRRRRRRRRPRAERRRRRASPRLAELRLDPNLPVARPDEVEGRSENGSRRCCPDEDGAPSGPHSSTGPSSRRAAARARPSAPRVARPRLEPPRQPGAARGPRSPPTPSWRSSWTTTRRRRRRRRAERREEAPPPVRRDATRGETVVRLRLDPAGTARRAGRR